MSQVLKADPRDELPTMVITDKDGYLVQVGDPAYADQREIGKYTRLGYTIRTMKFKEYVSLDLKWIYDKK